jgi:hypothetical protein
MPCEFKVFLMPAMRFFLILIGSLYFFSAQAQLESGNWYQIKIEKSGVYRVDGAQLKSWGIDLNGLSSNALRLFGNGGGMLPEANNVTVPEGLTENNIQIVDGGDGIFNENDYFLFFGDDPDQMEGMAFLMRMIISSFLVMTRINGTMITPIKLFVIKEICMQGLAITI